jgi:hypothetical protein
VVIPLVLIVLLLYYDLASLCTVLDLLVPFLTVYVLLDPSCANPLAEA